jgi:hypothetical protein
VAAVESKSFIRAVSKSTGNDLGINSNLYKRLYKFISTIFQILTQKEKNNMPNNKSELDEATYFVRIVDPNAPLKSSLDMFKVNHKARLISGVKEKNGVYEFYAVMSKSDFSNIVNDPRFEVLKVINIDSLQSDSQQAPRLSLYFDLDDVTKDDIVSVLSVLSDLYYEVSGDLLAIKSSRATRLSSI